MFNPWYKQLANQRGFKPSNVRKSQSITTAWSFAFSTIASFPQLLKGDTDLVASYYRIVHCTLLLATLLCLASHEQCSTWWLKVLHKHCNMDVLGVLPICPHSPSGAACPQDHWVKTLAAYIYVCMYVSKYSGTCVLWTPWDQQNMSWLFRCPRSVYNDNTPFWT